MYSPLNDEPALFRVFALETEADEGPIIGFANRYGSLGEPVTQQVLKLRRDAALWREDGGIEGEDEPLLCVGESLGAWCNAIRTMRRAVTMWDLIKTKDNRALSRMIHWEGERRVSYSAEHQPSELIASPDFHPELFEHSEPGDYQRPARLLVRNWTNECLRQFPPAVQLLFDSVTYFRLVNRIVPNSLIGALWMQFAGFIEREGTNDYKQCKYCLTWFPVGRGAARADKVFCKPSCKVSANVKKNRLRRTANEGLNRQIPNEEQQQTPLALPDLHREERGRR